MGMYIIGKLNALKMDYDIISEIRGKGLMIGIEFNTEIAAEVKDSNKGGEK